MSGWSCRGRYRAIHGRPGELNGAGKGTLWKEGGHSRHDAAKRSTVFELLVILLVFLLSTSQVAPVAFKIYLH